MGGEVERPHWPYATKLTISLLLLAFFIYLLSRFRRDYPPLNYCYYHRLYSHSDSKFPPKSISSTQDFVNPSYLYYCDGDHHRNSYLDHTQNG